MAVAPTTRARRHGINGAPRISRTVKSVKEIMEISGDLGDTDLEWISVTHTGRDPDEASLRRRRTEFAWGKKKVFQGIS